MISPAEATRILHQVAMERRLSVANLISPCRNDKLVRARAEVARRLRERGMPMQLIGAVLHRHHAMVIYYLRGNSRKLSRQNGWHAPKVYEWHAPVIAEIVVPPKKRYLVPYAGAELHDRYVWVERTSP